jgi:hypothetical protein
LDAEQESLLDFTRHVVRLRAEHPVFRRRRFFAGSADHGGESELGDIAWFEPDGQHMDEEAWANGYAKTLMVFLNGRAIRETDARGGAIRDDSFLVLFNAHYEPIDFRPGPQHRGPGLPTQRRRLTCRTAASGPPRPGRRVRADCGSGAELVRKPRALATTLALAWPGDRDPDGPRRRRADVPDVCRGGRRPVL